tara:strand:- start:5 stop:190 length:186 start_codon:yes stop_codon:yes gene_type:complete
MHTDKINNAEVVTATELFEIVNNCKHHWFEGQTPSDDEGNYIMYYVIDSKYYRVNRNLFNF